MRTLFALLFVACSPSGSMETDPFIDADTSAGCAYPIPAEPMAVGEPLAPYAWAQALRIADGVTTSLDLARAFCGTDTQYDWSPHDYMLFVSVPAW